MQRPLAEMKLLRDKAMWVHVSLVAILLPTMTQEHWHRPLRTYPLGRPDACIGNVASA